MARPAHELPSEAHDAAGARTARGGRPSPEPRPVAWGAWLAWGWLALVLLAAVAVLGDVSRLYHALDVQTLLSGPPR